MKLFFMMLLVVSCQTYGSGYKDLTVDYVDLSRFGGDWYVQGHTHLYLDKGAVNQIENYQIHDDGKIDITFSYYKELGGEPSIHRPKAHVEDFSTNAHWKVQFIWPFTSNFLVVRLASDYDWTVISVPGKDLIWIMSSTVVAPEMVTRTHCCAYESHRKPGSP